jgi:putative ABC transport system permease protein
MQPLGDIHLHSQHVQNEVNAGKEDARQMYVLVGIAILLMTIAVCNFVNLSTAKAVTRAKEVGIRKTVGAFRRQLIVQFLTESLVLMASATMLSLILIELISPWTAIPAIDNQLAYLVGDSVLVSIAIAVLAFSALAAGVYPALILSSQKTIQGLVRETGLPVPGWMTSGPAAIPGVFTDA